MAAETRMLADDFWLTAHDTTDGSSELQPRPLGIGLATAVLAELRVAGWVIKIDRRAMFLHPHAEGSALPDDPPWSKTLTEMFQEADHQRRASQNPGTPPTLNVDDWIEYLDRRLDIQTLVERRLQDSGLAVQQQKRSLFRGSQSVCVPCDHNTSGMTISRIKEGLRRRRELGEADLMLVGLCVATGLASAQAGLDAGDKAFLAHQLQTTVRSELRELLLRAEAAIGRLVMTR